jgi:hypothetical protein
VDTANPGSDPAYQFLLTGATDYPSPVVGGTNYAPCGPVGPAP